MLNNEEIKQRILQDNLVTNYLNLEKQLQPNGFDLTVQSVYAFKVSSYIGANEKTIAEADELIPELKPELFGENAVWHLKSGTYKFKINEIINLPKDLSADTIQRSSFMRAGCLINVGNWDRGYNGQGYSTIFVGPENGLWLGRNASIIQMRFFPVAEEGKTYNGSYQKENIE